VSVETEEKKQKHMKTFKRRYWHSQTNIGQMTASIDGDSTYYCRHIYFNIPNKLNFNINEPKVLPKINKFKSSFI